MNMLEMFVKIGAKDEASKAIEDAATNAVAKGNLIADAAGAIINTVQAAASTAFNAVKGVVEGAINSFGQFEQLKGGIETFFGDASATVIDNAKNAYQTAGMSANEYMSNVSSFAMTLVNSVAKERQQAAKGDTEAQKAELDNQYANLKQNLSDQYDATKQALDDDIDILKREQEDHKTVIKRTLDDELDSKRTSYKDAVQNLKDALDDEVSEFQKATDEKIKEINREYTEKLKLVDEEKYNALKAIDEEIDAINGQTKAERKALEEQNQQRRIAELEDRIARAENDEERSKAQEALNDYLAQIEQKAREDQRSEQIDALRKQKEDVNKHYSSLAESIKEEQATVTENYKTERNNELEVMKTNNAKQVSEAEAYYDGLLKEQQRNNEDYLKEVDRANSEEVKSAQRNRDQILKDLKAHNDQLLEESLSGVNATKAELDGIGEIIQVTDEDRQKAAEIADMAMRDMADNANKMGTNIESIEYAYQGFAKQNFTMLDNLKIGYAGTKDGIQQLIDDANTLAEQYGETRTYSVDSFSDIVEAIHLVEVENGIAGVSVDDLKAKMADNDFTLQELNKLGKAWAGDEEDTDSVAGNIERARSKLEEMSGEVENFNVLLGTTAKEGMTTYEGALGRVRGAWDNWLVAIADPEENPADETEALMKEVGNAAALIIPRVGEVLTALWEEVALRAPEIWDTFKTALMDSLPDEWKEKIQEFIDKVKGFFEKVETAIEWVEKFGPALLEILVAKEVLTFVGDLKSGFDGLKGAIDLLTGTGGLGSVTTAAGDAAGGLGTLEGAAATAAGEAGVGGLSAALGGLAGVMATTLGATAIVMGPVAGIGMWMASNEELKANVKETADANEGNANASFNSMVQTANTATQQMLTGAGGNVSQLAEEVKKSTSEMDSESRLNMAKMRQEVEASSSGTKESVTRDMSQLTGNLAHDLPIMRENAKTQFEGMSESANENGAKLRESLTKDTEDAKDGVEVNASGMAGSWKVSMTEMKTETSDRSDEIESRVSECAKAVHKSFTDKEPDMKTAGGNIIDSLWKGLDEAWNNGGIMDFIKGIGDWIVENKGPEEYDKRLLKPAGKWIMGGLKSGLEESFKRDVMPLVESMAGQMEDGFGNPTLTAGAGIDSYGTSRFGTNSAPQIVIQHMEVRSEHDIYKVSRELNELWQMEGAGSLI